MIPFNPKESGYLRNCVASSNPMSLVINFILFNLWFSKHNDHSPLPSLLHLYPFHHQQLFSSVQFSRSVVSDSATLCYDSWGHRVGHD